MKRLLLLLVIVVVAVVLAFMSLLEDPGHMETPVRIPEEPVTEEMDTSDEPQSAVEAERDARLAAMKDVYAELERERRNLRQRLNKVRFYLSDAELPASQAKKLQEELDSANRLLINPPLLGAFRGVEDIRQELDRIARINERLGEIELIVGALPDN